ncbi:hypothetical protein J1N35_001548, partial [Gossypium stocksii]
MRPKTKQVLWSKLIWFPLHIPKHSLVLWMEILNRVPTNNKLLARRKNIGGRHKLYLAEQETHDHFLRVPVRAHSKWKKFCKHVYWIDNLSNGAMSYSWQFL